MTKLQFQVPDELLLQLRSLAKQREWSWAEAFRRGVELLLRVYPETANRPPVAWTPPTSNRVGWKGLSANELRDVGFADGD